MITYAQSFDTLGEAEEFLNTLLLKEEFTIAKVARLGGDIYFIKPIMEKIKEDLIEQGFTFTDDGKFIPPSGYVAQAQGNA